MGFSRQNTGVGCHFLLQRIFPTQGSNPGLPHFRQTLYHLSHQVSLYPGYIIPLMKYFVKYFRHKSKSSGDFLALLQVSDFIFPTLLYLHFPILISSGTSEHLNSHQPDQEPSHCDLVNPLPEK